MNMQALPLLVLPKDKSLASVASRLKVITKQSELGRRLFGHRTATLHEEKLTELLKKLETKLIAEPVLEQITLQKHKRVIMDEMILLMGQEKFSARRELEVK